MFTGFIKKNKKNFINTVIGAAKEEKSLVVNIIPSKTPNGGIQY